MEESYGLVTDFYELTMTQGYFLEQNNPDVVFEMFYRSQPFQGGYALFAGLQPLIDQIHSFTYRDEDIAYLRSTGSFTPEFLAYLRDFSFSGDIYAMPEGTVVFPGEPLLRIHAPLIEAQLIESFLLNIINFQTLIATKTSRIFHASQGGKILEFGLRRAQGLDGALSATRASYIGGASGTSNTWAGERFHIPVMGTMAHSWIMSFDDELDSFRRFARHYPDNAVLLIDTYDTLTSGLPNAITIGKELKQLGKRIGVRIDSGDLSYLSKRVRSALDEAGLENATITVSNDLNEEIIRQLVVDGSPIDSWGVGTHLVTGGSQAAMNGVYKLAAKRIPGGDTYLPTMKLSNNLEKTTNPGIKQVYRFYWHQDALGDLITLEDEPMDQRRIYTFHHPMIDQEFFQLPKNGYTSVEPMLKLVMKQGSATDTAPSLQEIRSYAQQQLKTLDSSYTRIVNPHIYKVSISTKLKKLKTDMIRTYRRQMKS